MCVDKNGWTLCIGESSTKTHLIALGSNFPHLFEKACTKVVLPKVLVGVNLDV